MGGVLGRISGSHSRERARQLTFKKMITLFNKEFKIFSKPRQEANSARNDSFNLTGALEGPSKRAPTQPSLHPHTPRDLCWGPEEDRLSLAVPGLLSLGRGVRGPVYGKTSAKAMLGPQKGVSGGRNNWKGGGTETRGAPPRNPALPSSWNPPSTQPIQEALPSILTHPNAC